MSSILGERGERSCLELGAACSGASSVSLMLRLTRFSARVEIKNLRFHFLTFLHIPHAELQHGGEQFGKYERVLQHLERFQQNAESLRYDERYLLRYRPR